MVLLRKFSGFMGGTFTILMAQPRILETQVTPPPRDWPLMHFHTPIESESEDTFAEEYVGCAQAKILSPPLLPLKTVQMKVSAQSNN